MAEPLFVDTPENADWTKVGQFDVRVDDPSVPGGQRLARNVGERAKKMGKSIAEVKALPVYRGALRYWKGTQNG